MELEIIAQVNETDRITSTTYYKLKADENHSAMLAKSQKVKAGKIEKSDALYCVAFYRNFEYNTIFQKYFLDMIEKNKCEDKIDLDLTEIKVNAYLTDGFKGLGKLVEMYSQADKPEKYNKVLHSVEDYIYYRKVKEIIQKRKEQLESFLQQNEYLKINSILEKIEPEKKELAIKIYKRILMNTLIGRYNLKYYQKITEEYIKLVRRKGISIQTDNDFLMHLFDNRKYEMPDVSENTRLGDINQTYDDYFLFEDRER